MNWPSAIAVIMTFLGGVFMVVWRLSDANRRQLNMEEKQKEHHAEDDKRFGELEYQMQRQRDWKHDMAKPRLQEHDFRLSELEGRIGIRRPNRSQPRLEWTEEDDSRVTSDPKKEPTR